MPEINDELKTITLVLAARWLALLPASGVNAPQLQESAG